MGVQVALAVRVVEAVLGRPVERRALQGQRPRRRERPAARDARLEGPVAYGGANLIYHQLKSFFYLCARTI